MEAYFDDPDMRRADGRFFVDRERKKFCQDYNCRDPCPQRLSHHCEYCRGNHRSNVCGQNGWQHRGKHHGGKSKGKGKNKSKAKWQHRGW